MTGVSYLRRPWFASYFGLSNVVPIPYWSIGVTVWPPFVMWVDLPHNAVVIVDTGDASGHAGLFPKDEDSAAISFRLGGADVRIPKRENSLIFVHHDGTIDQLTLGQGEAARFRSQASPCFSLERLGASLEKSGGSMRRQVLESCGLPR
jgi:hypothetical protein